MAPDDDFIRCSKVARVPGICSGDIRRAVVGVSNWTAAGAQNLSQRSANIAYEFP
jgi:hypothetical protein